MTTIQNMDRTFDEEDSDVLDRDNVAVFSLGAGEPEDNVMGSCRSKQIYIDSGNDKKVLFMLSIGLRFNN